MLILPNNINFVYISFDMGISKLIHELRKSQFKTIEAASPEIGIDRQTLQKLETIRIPTAAHMRILTTHFFEQSETLWIEYYTDKLLQVIGKDVDQELKKSIAINFIKSL